MGNIFESSSPSLDVPKPQQKHPRFPKRLILIRHGESLGNKDEQAYCTIPDWLIPLTELGHVQSIESGKKIKSIVNDEPLSVFCSPYLRTKQTMGGVMSHN